MSHWLVLVAIAVVCSALLLAQNRRKRRSPRQPDLGVSVDDEGIRRDIGSIRERVRWRDLERIIIVTSDEGPYVEDVFWLFVANDGSGCAVPGSAVGDAVFSALSKLRGVDYGAIARAMGSTENASFTAWSRGATEMEVQAT